MTFADRLEELRKAVTPGPWEAKPRRLVIDGQRGPLMSYLYGNHISPARFCVSLASERVADHEIVAFLANHAAEIENLVRAAEQLIHGAPPEEAIHHMTNALSALDKESDGKND